MLKRLLSITFCLCVTAGCGKLGGNSVGSAAGASGPNPSPSTSDAPLIDQNIVPNWDNPIEGVGVASVDDANHEISFDALEPKGLGTPAGIYVSGEEVPKDFKVVAFVYDTADFGLVDIVERIPESPPDEYEKFHEYLVSLNGDPLTHGRFDLVTIRANEQALVTTSEDGTRCVVFWLEGGIEYIVEGPTLSFDQAVKVSELL